MYTPPDRSFISPAIRDHLADKSLPVHLACAAVSEGRSGGGPSEMQKLQSAVPSCLRAGSDRRYSPVAGSPRQLVASISGQRSAVGDRRYSPVAGSPRQLVASISDRRSAVGDRRYSRDFFAPSRQARSPRCVRRPSGAAGARRDHAGKGSRSCEKIPSNLSPRRRGGAQV
jgi:hypothetical protein